MSAQLCVIFRPGRTNIHDRCYFPSHSNSNYNINPNPDPNNTNLNSNPNPNHNHTPSTENSLEQIQLSVPGDGKYHLWSPQVSFALFLLLSFNFFLSFPVFIFVPLLWLHPTYESTEMDITVMTFASIKSR